MDRRIKFIDHTKWYHIESLKKYYKNEGKSLIRQDLQGKLYNIVKFRSGWSFIIFVVNPKNKRLKYLTADALNEIGCIAV